MSVYIGAATKNDYSAMRGPCSEGFHVPSKDERVALCGILTSTFSMASNTTTMGTYLKMPAAGLRNRSSSGVAGQGSNGYYWASTAYSSGRTYYLYITSSSLNPQEVGYRGSGFSVRCFKDIPIIPDNNWTTLYQGTGSAGVFRNSSLGLISVSGDGTTWYTIQDKNLGATTVYNQGDTLSDANCGYFYQWGNNYGFAHSGTITTSSTQVDASNYGPGNYYNSSTFITTSSSPYDWSSVQNDNLWGGVTGVQQIPKELKSAYIGEYEEGWKPGANTVAYRPLNSTTTVNDLSGNNYNLTNNGATFTTQGGVECVYTASGYLTSGDVAAPSGGNSRTISFWCYNTSSQNQYYGFYGNDASGGTCFNFLIREYSSGHLYEFYQGNMFYSFSTPTLNAWEQIILTYENSVFKLYVNGTLVGTKNITLTTTPVSSALPFRLSGDSQYGNNLYSGYLSEFIVEDIARTAQEITDYYNLTKGNYGL